MNTAKERDTALRVAREWARKGNADQAIRFLGRAQQFDYVSDQKRNNILRIIEQNS